MKTPQETPTPTIAELWGELQKEESKAKKHWDTYERTKSDNALIWHTKARVKVNSLRSTLLEETTPYFVIVGDKAEAGKALEDYAITWKITEFRLKEIATAANFTAWELSKRQKETKNTEI